MEALLAFLSVIGVFGVVVFVFPLTKPFSEFFSFKIFAHVAAPF
ncbi:hypothetical protein ABI157_14250 [Faecalibacterium prausnitzii]